MNNDDVKKIQVSKIFLNINYLIPIYQRNYAWDELQIKQLIEDIEDIEDIKDIEDSQNEYFIGNLIVNKNEKNLYEVIDGQQRLTTLFLIYKYLKMPIEKESLRFEAREKSNRTLADIDNREDIELPSEEINNGFKIIKNYFELKKIDAKEFKEKLKKVFLIQVQVPKDIDLNHYFEIMNTRGEQLELHEIAKAKLLGMLQDNKEKILANMIWEACSDMNSYVQMNFDTKIRNIIFPDKWSNLKIENFDKIIQTIQENNSTKDTLTLEAKKFSSLKKILQAGHSDIDNLQASSGEDENERFESIISFPNFLLQVAVVMKKTQETESTLDDKHFLENLKEAWKSTENAKEFLFHLLKCRFLFDKYILKREFAKDYKETGKWSLQRLEKYLDNKGNANPQYLASLEENINKQLRTLQSCLRITYTSPKTMHWISLVLSHLINEKKDLINETPDIINLLENYCREKLENYCWKKIKDSDCQNSNDFLFERIVFSYLDYLIYRDGYKQIISKLQDNWQFQFRNSIEHFYPQNPTDIEHWNSKELNVFGNLALITVSGNSRFSNLSPSSKIDTYPSIINQSLKLTIMADLTQNNKKKWTTEIAKKHEDAMFKILESDCEKLKD